MTTFQAADFTLAHLSDAQVTEEMLKRSAPTKYLQFPYFMILKFVKVALPNTEG